MSTSHRAGGKRSRMTGQPSLSPENKVTGSSLVFASTNCTTNANSNSSRNASSQQQQQQQASAAPKEEEDHQHQAANNNNNNNNNNNMAVEDSSFWLLRLSRACKRHQAWHQENPQENNSFPCIPVENIPEFCQQAISTLGRALPNVEDKYQAAVTGEKSANNINIKGLLATTSTTPEHVGHMCDFYRDVLAGGFCPHAPHLFQLGRGAIDIMPRIHFLFQHVVSKSIISNTIATIHHVNAENAAAAAAAAAAASTTTCNNRAGAADDGSTTTNHSSSISLFGGGGVADTIADTVARLLHAIPEFHLQACILRDLVNLAFDLTLLLTRMPAAEDNDASHHFQQQQQNQQPPQWVAVEVVLMPETVQQSGSFVIDHRHDDDTTTTTTTQEFVITLSSADAATALLTAIYKITVQWMELKKMQRLRPPQDVYADIAITRALHNNNNDSSSSPMSSASSLNLSIASNLYFYSILEKCEENHDILSNLRAALGQILVTSSTSDLQVMMTHRGRLLHWKCQAAAAQMDIALFHDYARNGGGMMSSVSEIVELALVSVRAARQYLQSNRHDNNSGAATADSRQHSSKSPSSSPRGSPCGKRTSLLSSPVSSSCSCRMALGQALATLVSDALLTRHWVPGSTAVAEVQSMVQRATVPTLLECVSCILAEKSTVALFCSITPTRTTNNRSDRELARVLFSALHQAVQDDVGGAGFVAMTILTHPTNHGQILRKLFSVLSAGWKSFHICGSHSTIGSSIPCTDLFFMETTVNIMAAILRPVNNNTNYCLQPSMSSLPSSWLILVDIQNVCRWCMAENERESNDSVTTSHDESPSAGSKRKSNESSPTGNQNRRRKKSCEDSKNDSEPVAEFDCAVSVGKVDDVSFRSPDEELGRLLLQACRSMRSLRNAMSHIHSPSASNAETADNELRGKLQRSITDVLRVSNALQLLSLLLASQHTPFDAEQNDSVTALLKLMVSVLLELFDSFRINGELSIPKEGPPNMLWETAAQCAETAVSKPIGHSDLDKLFRPLVLFVENDLWVLKLLQGHNGLPLDTLLRSVDPSEERQDWRLRVLNLSLGKTALPHSSLSLQQRTFDIVDNFDTEHSDPRIRLLRWQSTVWLFLSATKPQELRRILTNSSHTSNSDSIAAESMISGLLTTAFADKDPRVRDYTSRELGRFLVTNDHMAVLATLSRNDEWRNMWQVDNDQAKIVSVSEVISRFYKAVDKLLYQYCKVPESELSFTVAPSNPSHQGHDVAQSRDSMISFQRAAVRFILSTCEGLDTTMHSGRLVLQNSLMRVIRLWSSNNFQVETTGLSFGEISRTFRRVGAHNLLHSVFMECFTPVFFQDTLVGFNEKSERQIANLPPPWIVERQYRMLLAFIQQFLVGPSVGPTGDSVLTQVAGSFLEKWLPFVIAQMVVEKDYGSLRLTTGFKLFLLSKKRDHDNARKRSSTAIYADLLSDRVHTEKMPSKSPSWTRDLEYETSKLCLAPYLSDRIIALLLKGAEKSELAFYTRDVLQNKMSLKSIISSRQQVILRELVINLGHSRTGTGPALKAIKAAATALFQSDPSSQSGTDSKGKNLSHESATTAASDWISTNFMFLLVDVVQSRWAQKDEAERVHAMRCLKFILPLLIPKEAAQYFPQMMTTVNAAISQQTHTDSRRLCLVSEVRCLAVEGLDKFVRLVAQQQMEALGENLTSVVVSLIPVIAEDEDERGFNDRHIETIKSKTTDEAVALLEWLSGGDRGRKLARCWKGIPFLPQTPVLDVVRANLRKVKVDYDNLLATDTQMTSKRSTLSSSSKQSEGGSASGDSKSASSSPKKLLDLRKRLDMICTFLGNENASIRRVFLDHLLSLLRSHRELFLALIDNEGSSSMKRFLTEVYPGAIQSSRGVVTEMVTTLLGRCVRETDPNARVLLATCFGEVGAIAEQKLEVSVPTAERGGEVLDNAYDAYDWRLQRPPWQTLASQYQLQLVTKDLVTTMKAAPDSTDQHKVAFAIQQLLVLLDKSATKEDGGHPVEEPQEEGRNKPPMSQKLSKALADAGVLDKVEPYWFSEFREKDDPFTVKQPPFFQNSTSYYSFLSNWIWYMEHRASESRKSEWTMCFHACRFAFRTQAALSVAEFLLPILVLDRICFGNGHDEEVLIREIRDALTFGNDDSRPVETRMSHSERQKAVSVIFSLIDTFQAWSERDAEERNQGHSRSGNGHQSTDSNSDWQREESVMRIEDVLQAVPLSLQAHAAASVGMHARALRLLETASRATVADEVFNAGSSDHTKVTRSRASGSCPAGSLDLMKKTLAALNDHDTMVSLEGESIVGDPLTRAFEAIRRTEASGDWNGALQAYERAQQLAGPEKRDTDLNRGALQCLLELGHFESVLSQVKGVLNAKERKGDAGKILPYAIEAAWRLGRWDTLSEMSCQAATTDLDPDGRHMLHVGQTMLALHDGNLKKAQTALKDARIAVMDRLSSAAQESYTRAYDHVVKLHCLREIEDAAQIICVTSESPTLGSFALYGDGNWERRLNLAAPDSTVKIINTRLALARLGRDLSLEGSLFLGMGKRARKKGDFHIANSAFSQAEGAFDSATSGRSFHLEKCSLQMEIARLRHANGEFTSALQLVALDDVEGMADLDEPRLRAAALERVRNALRINEHGMDEDQMIEVFVHRALQSTEWMIQGGLAGGSETMARFRTIQRVDPKWEKGHFQYARYIESAMQSRMSVLQRRFSRQRVGVDENLLRSHTFVEDRACQKYLLLAVKHYVEALSLELTHLYQALPRLLFLWFDFTSTSTSTLSGSLSRTVSEFTQHRSQPSVNDALKELAERQKELNVFLAKEITRIPALAFYTALPQLISRISTNDQSESYLVVRNILKRVLAKFPAQAMWPLAWVRQSKDAARREVGNEIFQAAERSHFKLRNTATHSLLVASQSLFKYLLDLAQLNVKSLNKKEVRIKPWVGETELAEFIPPVQAALTPSSIPAKYSRTTDVFLTRNVPRLKAFSRNVSLMSSKARPKKLKAIAVSADPNARNPTRGKDDCHLGEIHFLVKQEAKGDLRKDARVQDLNNVINRLLASSGDGKGSSSRQRRRLHLRTFAVTCLSEDTGILEWVPNTSSLRNLVSEAYNPQAAPLSSKRRGLRMTNPGDPILRNSYEKKCQEMYFVSRNLKRAAALFEELLLKPNPPLLHWWFVQQYRNPHDWYEARTRFAESTAVWSAVGHVIGLGDRHAENILVDVSRGECVHVDFDCIFDKGLNLPKPEVIPFRLTSNMIDAFGPTGADGVYSGSLKDAMKTLRDNRDTLLSVLEPFLKDPIIDWKRTRSQQQKMRASGATGIVPASTQDRQTKEAKRSIHVIDERLRGIYNLRNPNHKKIRRADGMGAAAGTDDQEHDEMTQLMPLNVPGQVHKMIAEATSSENLVQLFVGWMPWV